jgi:hypothetical protein
MHFRSGVCALFVFSLTSSALAERLHVAEMPHIHAEIAKPKLSPSLSTFGASGVQHIEVSVADFMPWCSNPGDTTWTIRMHT